MIIQITDDLDLDRIAQSGQCFRWKKTEDSTYRIIAGGSCLYITSLGTSGAADGDGRFELDCSEAEFECFWKKYFDLEENYREIRGRIDPGLDPFLWQAAENEKGIRILRQDPWEMLITSIITQNRNIPAICRSVELLAESCGRPQKDSRGCIYYTFPEPAALAVLSEEELKECKLGYRWKYVRAAAEAVAEGKIDPEKLACEEEERAIKALTGLFGVGVKVASCVSLFGLHHLDAFPVDVWVRRILENEYPDGYPFERYSPYNGIYQQYMFAWYRHAAADRHSPASGAER